MVIDDAILNGSAFSAREFHNLMDTDSSVDVERLREATRLGCPPSLRGEVWKFMLGVSLPDRGAAISVQKRLLNDFARMQNELTLAPSLAPDLLRRLRREIQRRANAFSYLRHTSPVKSVNDGGDTTDQSSSSDQDTDMMEKLILIYLANNRTCEFEISLVYLLAPFMNVLSDPCDIYFCFSSFREYIDAIESQGIDNLLAKFMMLFRTFENEICTHFEDEELRPNEWAISWLKHLLCKELPLPCVLRLWDAYFADSADIELHMFVCLALLGACKEALLECEHSELKGLLRHLPILDIDQILVQASNFQQAATAALSTVDSDQVEPC